MGVENSCIRGDEVKVGDGRCMPCRSCLRPISFQQDAENANPHNTNIFPDKCPSPTIKHECCKDMYDSSNPYYQLPGGIVVDLAQGKFLDHEHTLAKQDFNEVDLRSFISGRQSDDVENVHDISAKGLMKETKAALQKTLETGADFPKEVVYFRPGEAWGNISDSSYQTIEELNTLERNVNQIASDMGASKIIFELGPGTFQKTKIILDKLETLGVERFYFAVDVNRRGLRKIAELNAKYKHVKCIGLVGTFDQGLAFALKLASAFTPFRNSTLMSFGSTFSNNHADDLKARMKMWRLIASYILLGQDTTRLTKPVHDTYHTKAYEELLWNGMREADRIMGGNNFASSTWLDCAIEGDVTSSHAFRLRTTEGVEFEAFKSIKYTETQMIDIIQRAGFRGAAFGGTEPNAVSMKLYHMRRSKLEPQDETFWWRMRGFFNSNWDENMDGP